MRAAVALFILAAGTLLGTGGRLVYLEQAQGPEMRRRAEKQQTGEMTIPAQRGEIFDAAGRVLAGSLRRPSIYVDATQEDDARYAAHSIAPVLGLKAADLEKLLLEKRQRAFVWVKREISDEELRAFQEVRRLRHLNAFGVVYEPQRRYPLGRMASSVIGFVGAEQHGLAGIEQEFDAILTGKDGRQTSTVDARRRPVRERADEYVAPRDGATVVLTIESHIQQIAERNLREAVEQYKALWGTAVVMHPHSGEVLAMASYPDFDPNVPFPGVSGTPSKEEIERTRNRAIADAYEPGSIFKPFMACPAVEAGIARLEENFAVNGPQHSFGSRIIHDTHTYGTLSLREVISKSSNIGMGMLGSRIGNARLHEFVRRFGFGDVTGITLPGEHSGLVNDFDSWTSFSTQSIPIGQEVGVTPIQLLTAFSAFANGGVLYRPRVVRGIIDADGGVIEDHSTPIPIRRVLDAQVARKFRLEALVEVVQEGTGKNADIEPYQVFGKTGTAQIAHAGGRGYAEHAYVGSFIGGAPAEEPRVVVIVSIYWPRSGGYYGGTVAAPSVANILADTLRYLGVPPEPHKRASRGAGSVGGW
ncbi:MAG: penicillin-binding protein 2 [Phycisphaerae bacterium]